MNMKKTIKLLSVDFDYFIDIDKDTRNNKFPDGLDDAPRYQLSKMWKDAYLKHPELENIGLVQFDLIKEYVNKSKYELGRNMFLADSHKDIKKVIDMIPLDVDIEVYNIDFHHDYYHFYTGGDRYNCGNWVRRLLEDRPSTQVTWFRRIDSETVTLEGEVPFRHTPFLPMELKFIDADYIFICESPEWTPPHLHRKFVDIISHMYL